MSGQYPGGYNNPLAGHRGQFNPQQQQQQQMMNQMQMGTAGGSGMMSGAGGGPGGGMMSMGGATGGYGQGGMMPQQGNPMQQGMQGMGGSVGSGGMGPGVMNPVGMQSPSHVQQQLMQQQQMQQMGGPMGPQMGMGMGGHVGMGPGSGTGAGGGNPQMGNIMPQQQQMASQMQQNVGMQPAHQMQSGPGGPNMGAMMAAQQQSMQQQQTQQSPAAQQQQSGMQQTQQMPQSSGQQQQQPQQPQTSTNNVLAIHQQPHKEINIVSLSRVGQETVQDITSRFQEIFTALKVIQPTGSRENGTVKKVQEHFRTIRLLFKRMRLIYERCIDGCPQGMEYTHVESLIPYKDETEHRNLEGTQCDEYRKALQENQELIDTVKLKNRQLREIIDRTRIIVWEINTMLSMRRS